MIRKLLTVIFVLSLLVGCNLSDYKYSEDSNQICDDETKICYPVNDTVAETPENNDEDFNREFEKLKKIVENMNKEEGPETKEIIEVKEEPSEIKEEIIEVKEEVVNKTSTPVLIDFEREKTVVDKYVRAYAGELIKLNVKSNDPDGDILTYTFSKPLDENGEWQTTKDDIGKYNVYVTVTDGKYRQTKRIQLDVTKFNRPPVLEYIEDVEVYEGETVYVRAKASDADNDPITYKYSGWTNTYTKKTGYDDSGEYKITVTVRDDDGEEDSQVVNIIVRNRNRPPVIEEITLG